MSLSKIRTALAVLLLVAPLAGAQQLPAEIKIGALETLTGDSSVYGLSIKAGLELAFEEINAKGVLGASKLKLTILDEKADKQEGISVMNKLINDEKVSAVF